MRIWRRRFPVALRIGTSISVVVVLLAGFMLLYFPRQHIDTSLRDLEDKTTIVTSMAADQVKSALDFDDMDAVTDALKGLANDKTFIFAALYDDKGKMLQEFHAKTKRGIQIVKQLKGVRVSIVDSPVLKYQTDLLEIRFPVVTRSGKKANLLAGFSTHLAEKLRKDIRRTTLLAAFITLIASLAVGFWVGRYLGKRMSKVVTVAKKVAAGYLSLDRIEDEVNDEIGDLVVSFNAMNDNLGCLASHVIRVADGDLSGSVDIEGELASAFNRMLASQRELVRQIAETATQVNSSAAEFLSNAKQQEGGATNQSTAVEEIRRTLESLLNSAREIGASAQDVLKNAESSQGNSQVVASKIAALSTNNERIADILENIKDIANKSDLLALNAALEGTKAGELGRGFSLVASQMQRLAENVMGSVRDVKELTTTITESTESAVLATEESTKLSSDTTRSARQIGLIIQQQQTGTEQATRAMIDVGEIAAQTAAGSKEIVNSAADLMALSERLQALVGSFRLGPDRPRDQQDAST